MVIVTVELRLCCVGGRLAGVSESSVATCLRVTVVVCISVRIIDLFQIPPERHGQDTRRIHQNHLSHRLESDAPQRIDALPFHFLSNYFHFTNVH